MHRKAFTLIELLVVIAIIGILATIALSATQSARKRAADAKNKSDAQTVLKAWVTNSSDTSGFYSVTTTAQLTIGAAGSTAALTTLDTYLSTGGNTDLRAGFTPVASAGVGYTGTQTGTLFDSTAIAVGVPLTVKAALNTSTGTFDCGILPSVPATSVDAIFGTTGAANCVNPWFVVTQK